MSTRTERQDNKALNDKHTKILKELMMQSDNRKCSDCRKRDPRWASWNLGIFFCIRCSGIHRSLGTHISKVKSADLDTWTPEQIENMKRWGNAKANLYWEHDWPRDMEPPESNIDQFIRAKYERKQYCMKGPIPDPDTLGVGNTRKDVAVTNVVKPSETGSASFDLLGTGFPSTNQKPAPTTSSSSASQQLFDAFQSAPTSSSQQQQQQAQTSMKSSILSLYGAPSPVRAANMATSPMPYSFPANSGMSAQMPAQMPAQPASQNFASFASIPSQSIQPLHASQLPSGSASLFSSNISAVAPQPATMKVGLGSGMSPLTNQPTMTPTNAFGDFSNFSSSNSAAVPPMQTSRSSFSDFGGFQSVPAIQRIVDLPSNPVSTHAAPPTQKSSGIPDFAGFSIPSNGSSVPNASFSVSKPIFGNSPPPRDTTQDEWSAFQ